MILVIEKHKNGIWKGEIDSKVGYFPASHCIFLSGEPCVSIDKEDETTREKRTSYVRTSLMLPGGDGGETFLQGLKALEEKEKEQEKEKEEKEGMDMELEEDWGEEQEKDILHPQQRYSGTSVDKKLILRLYGELCFIESFADFTQRRIDICASEA